MDVVVDGRLPLHRWFAGWVVYKNIKADFARIKVHGVAALERKGAVLFRMNIVEHRGVTFDRPNGRPSIVNRVARGVPGPYGIGVLFRSLVSKDRTRRRAKAPTRYGWTTTLWWHSSSRKSRR